MLQEMSKLWLKLLSNSIVGRSLSSVKLKTFIAKYMQICFFSSVI